MILLDTNVISEIMRPTPEPRVVIWLNLHPRSEYWLSAITVAEIGLGIALLPEGKRKKTFAEMAANMFKQDFFGRCLPFDQEAANYYAHIVATARKAGRAITVEDAEIAAIALKHDCLLATRNTRDFVSIDGLRLLNPWDPESDI